MLTTTTLLCRDYERTDPAALNLRALTAFRIRDPAFTFPVTFTFAAVVAVDFGAEDIDRTAHLRLSIRRRTVRSGDGPEIDLVPADHGPQDEPLAGVTYDLPINAHPEDPMVQMGGARTFWTTRFRQPVPEPGYYVVQTTVNGEPSSSAMFHLE